eukprot:2154461-Pyramimonas_sp.AAC.1
MVELAKRRHVYLHPLTDTFVLICCLLNHACCPDTVFFAIFAWAPCLGFSEVVLRCLVVRSWEEDVTGRGLFAPYSPTPHELIQGTFQVRASTSVDTSAHVWATKWPCQRVAHYELLRPEFVLHRTLWTSSFLAFGVQFITMSRDISWFRMMLSCRGYMSLNDIDTASLSSKVTPLTGVCNQQVLGLGNRSVLLDIG